MGGIRKMLIIGIILLIVATVSATVVFFFPYQPGRSPTANATGSTQQGIQKVVNANNQFTFDLYSALNKAGDDNIFYSPYSISAALAMTYEGAEGQTADEMQSVFHFPNNSILRPNFAAIYNNINKEDKAYKLSTGNALWAQYDYTFLDKYLNTVEKYYGGKAASLDFKRETEKSRQTMNSFIEQQTNNKIRNLISRGQLSSMTRLVLTNAIYFKGTWVYQFDKEDTKEMDFKTSPNNTVKAPMMYLDNDDARFNYAETDNLQVLEMPYEGGNISMLVLLPKDNLGSIERELDVESLAQYKNMMEKEKVTVYLPKFTFETKYRLNGPLSEMGMPTAFSSKKADFSGMTGKQDLFISFVVHQAFVDVNEEGTEAAAATGVGMELTAVRPGNVFRADHPFIFIIQEKDTGNILFLGRVVDPTK